MTGTGEHSAGPASAPGGLRQPPPLLAAAVRPAPSPASPAATLLRRQRPQPRSGTLRPLLRSGTLRPLLRPATARAPALAPAPSPLGRAPAPLPLSRHRRVLARASALPAAACLCPCCRIGQQWPLPASYRCSPSPAATTACCGGRGRPAAAAPNSGALPCLDGRRRSPGFALTGACP
ncbi:skin secretory protein xP2-like [Triticum urartu]|uniref:skin secretory protein xP2-like n=1 Tax=Triticum urartu TaxID=4572 RepID=UPI002043C226|nr:skin secretory protein xP2-like [Triticum urartu]